MGTFRESFNKGAGRETTAKIIGTGVLAGLGYKAVVTAMGATETVISLTAIPGAIKTATVMVNGVPYVMSVVKAGLLSKLILGGVLVTGALVASALVYGAISGKYDD